MYLSRPPGALKSLIRLLCRPKNWVWPGVHSIQQILEKVIKLLVFLVIFLKFFGLEIDNMQKCYNCIMNQWPNDWIEMNNINPFLNKLILQISLIWFDKANSKQSKYLQIDLNLPATLLPKCNFFWVFCMSFVLG